MKRLLLAAAATLALAGLSTADTAPSPGGNLLANVKSGAPMSMI